MLEHPVMHRRIAQIQHPAGALRPAFGGCIGQLGQGLGAGDADADRDARPLLHPGLQAMAEGVQGFGQAGQIGEHLVDAVALQARHQGRQGAHHPVAEIAIEGIVGTEGRHFAAPGQFAHLEPGRRHGDAQALGLGRTGDHAAVIVGQHHHRAPGEIGAENPLATAIEGVAVDQRQHRLSHGRNASGCGWPRPRPRSRRARR